MAGINSILGTQGNFFQQIMADVPIAHSG